MNLWKMFIVFSDKAQIFILEADIKNSVRRCRSYSCLPLLIELGVHGISIFLVLPWSQVTLRVWKSHEVSYTASRKSIFNSASWIAFHGNRRHQTHAKWEIKACWKYDKKRKAEHNDNGILRYIYFRIEYLTNSWMLI